MSYGTTANEAGTQELLTALDDAVRGFLGLRPDACVQIDLTLLQRADAEHVDVSHGFGEWLPTDASGDGWKRGLLRAGRASSASPTRAERRAAMRGRR